MGLSIRPLVTLLHLGRRNVNNMLVIRKEQNKAFEDAMLEGFITEMVAHTQEFSPILCNVIGEPQVKIVVRQAVESAQSYEFINRGPVELVIDMSFLFGSAFDTDPQYPWAGKILNNNTLASQTANAEELYEKTLDYNEKVGGPDNKFTREALAKLSKLARSNTQYSKANLTLELLSQIKQLYPQKFHYVGEVSLRALIEEGIKKATLYGFSAPRELALIVILMFAFGHGCATDPLYPWIKNTLKDPRIIGSAARAKRLEKNH